MKRFLFPRLRTIWLVLIVLMSLPALTFTLRMRATARIEAADAARDSVLRVVRLAADRHQRLMESTRQVLFIMGRLPAFQTGDLAACDRLCADLIQQYPRYANLGVAHLSGAIAASGVPVPPSFDAAGRDWFQRLASSPELQAGDYHLDDISGKPVAVLSHPVLDASGRLKFVAFAALDLDWILQLFNAAHLPQGSMMWICDAKGKILARSPEAANQTVTRGLETDILKAINAGLDGTAEVSGVDGIRRLYAVTRLPDHGNRASAYVGAGIPTSEVYARADRHTASVLLILALTAALAASAMWVAGEACIARGLRSIGDAAQRLRKGDWTARCGVRNEAAEVREVSLAFDDMAGAIEARAADRARELSIAQECGARQQALLDRVRENERVLSLALEEASRKIDECARSEEAAREEVQYLKEALRASARENAQLGRREEILRQSEDAARQCLDSSLSEIVRLKVLLAETCVKLKQAENQPTEK